MFLYFFTAVLTDVASTAVLGAVLWPHYSQFAVHPSHHLYQGFPSHTQVKFSHFLHYHTHQQKLQ